MSSTARLVFASLAVALSACSHHAKMDTAKLKAAHRVAIVGACTPETWPGIAGISTTFDATWGSVVLPSQTGAFEATLAQAWTGVELMPLSQVANRPDLPKATSRYTCFGNVNTINDKKRPDLALMKQLAEALQVDAVLTLWTSPMVKSGGSKALVRTGGTAYLVDRQGTLIGTVKIPTVESAEIEKLLSVGMFGSNIRTVTNDEFRAMGTSLGQALATKLGESLRNP